MILSEQVVMSMMLAESLVGEERDLRDWPGEAS